MTSFDPARFNPMWGNPLRERADAQSLVPQLRGQIPAGVTMLATAAMALPPDMADAALAAPPAMPDLGELEALARSGLDVSALLAPERF